MPLADFIKLRSTSKLSLESPQFSFSFSKNKKIIWISTNLPLSGKVSVELKSLSKRALGGPVHITAQAVLKDHLIEITDFTFLKGKKFIDADYEIQIKNLNRLSVHWTRQLFYKRQKSINFEENVLISNLRQRDFEKLLKKYLIKKNKNTLGFYEELIQKYQTVRGITKQIKEAISNVFTNNEAKWNKKVNAFEVQYTNQFGVFFTEFVKNNEKSFDSIVLKKFENSKEVLVAYKNLSELATQIGRESMLTLEELTAYNPSQSVVKFENLELKSLGRFQRIIDECNKKIKHFSKL